MSGHADNSLPLLRFLVLFGAMLGVALGLAALSPPPDADPTAVSASPSGK